MPAGVPRAPGESGHFYLGETGHLYLGTTGGFDGLLVIGRGARNAACNPYAHAHFAVSGTSVDASAIAHTLVRDSLVRVQGRIDEKGRLHAERIQLHHSTREDRVSDIVNGSHDVKGDRSGRSGRGDREERGDRSGSGRGDRPERSERSDRPDREERSGRD